MPHYVDLKIGLNLHRVLVTIPGRFQVCAECESLSHYTSDCPTKNNTTTSYAQKAASQPATTNQPQQEESLATAQQTISPTLEQPHKKQRQLSPLEHETLVTTNSSSHKKCPINDIFEKRIKRELKTIKDNWQPDIRLRLPKLPTTHKTKQGTVVTHTLYAAQSHPHST